MNSDLYMVEGHVATLGSHLHSRVCGLKKKLAILGEGQLIHLHISSQPLIHTPIHCSRAVEITKPPSG